MATRPVPKGYHTVTPYLSVKEPILFMNFLKNAFGAEEKSCFKSENGKVMHAEMRIGDSLIMLAEACDKMPAIPASLYLYLPDVDKVYRDALTAGAISVMAPADQFYGDRSGGIRDPFGNQWWIATHIEDISEQELANRVKKLEAA